MPTLDKLDSAFNKVRQDLLEVGLLDEEIYLDQIDCVLSPLPSIWKREAGFFYNVTDLIDRLIGYEEGVIYIPVDSPSDSYVPGGTLVDTIRHEFGHAWKWIDPEFFERKWYTNNFVEHYWEGCPLGTDLYNCFTKYPEKWAKSPYYDHFITPYSMVDPEEEFCETFMMYLRYRRSLSRFRKRKEVYKKLIAVRDAVKTAAKELGLR